MPCAQLRNRSLQRLLFATPEQRFRPHGLAYASRVGPRPPCHCSRCRRQRFQFQFRGLDCRHNPADQSDRCLLQQNYALEHAGEDQARDDARRRCPVEPQSCPAHRLVGQCVWKKPKPVAPAMRREPRIVSYRGPDLAVPSNLGKSSIDSVAGPSRAGSGTGITCVKISGSANSTTNVSAMA